MIFDYEAATATALEQWSWALMHFCTLICVYDRTGTYALRPIQMFDLMIERSGHPKVFEVHGGGKALLDFLTIKD